MKHLLLADNWQFKQRTPALPLDDDLAIADNWRSATIPGCVHLDLLAHELIPEPFYGTQEQQVQWVGEQDWLYRCHFSLTADFLTSDEHVSLCFDGLDTFATVWLNGTQILVSDNMFLPQRIEVAQLLHAGHNELSILFASAWHEGKARETQGGAYPLWNGDSSRLYVRKAQYHYGWDWGPTLITAGVWRAVRLEAYTARIADVHCPGEVAADLESARLPVQVVLAGDIDAADLALHMALYAPDGELAAESLLTATATPSLSHSFELSHPQLWWPHGYGEQALYRLVVSLRQHETVLAQQEQRLGLRRLQLVQRPLLDAPGTSFFFEVNNTPVFCGGANWIPADSFGPRITSDRYRQWLQLAVAGNMSMVRIWGGGYYEEDVFYDLCDELGLLVWQDFMFGCGLYPAPEWMQASVRAEAIANVQRLRHHPSLVIWAGNNEDYALAHSKGVYDPNVTSDLASSAFPARAIYEEILPEVCATYDPTRPYWPSSPFGSTDADVNNLTIGDQHIWTIWHGLVPYQNYPAFSGRFVSEFGMQSFPDIRTIRTFTPEEERYPQSRTLDHHNKNVGGPAKVAAYLVENFRVPGDLEGYIYVTQLLQSEAMGAGGRGWRRRWSGEGREYVAGALIWQLNDCWPVTSWALVDYYLRAKPAYYVVKRELAPLSVGLAQEAQGAAIWAVNGQLVARQVELVLTAWTVDGELVGEEKRSADLLPNQATELGHYAPQPDAELIIGARLQVDGEVLARTVLWPEPLKYLALRDPDLTIERLGLDMLQVRVQRPAKGVFFTADEDVQWSDNMLDMLPDDVQY
ncbi:MAG TPA: glycoside hydrolase family 2 protein, partial [Ktedonobacteraceae bacterium]